MLLPPAAPRSASRFAAPPVTGLRSLLVAPDAATAARGVVTRAATMRCRSSGVVEASGGGRTGIGQCEEDIGKAKDTEEEDVKGGTKVEEAAEIGTEEEEDGFWVSYGRRRPRRRLPPLIPSLVARGALRRTRTADGRLVIRIVPVVRPECIRARRNRGGDRLTMQLVEHQDDSPMMAPPAPPREPSSSARQGDNAIRIAQRDADTATTAEAVAAPEPETTTVPAAVPPPRVSSAGCFEDVFRFGPIGGSSLRQMPSLIRMVH
ncbi:unnamed protein product [Urochloa decumbens]|uniref:FAF domain-containing protein n=1 Tax=Urochloa decumbens TaxID=240449 RepID=A0ABC8ZTJ0_9POAL